ncbi:MAG: carboxymuconolactone decarboxylase family protein [Caulobacteraceae bacterium]|nr:carboxymuconolactone decarboxylase family protein [Caulobacteraceae bacterium]
MRLSSPRIAPVADAELTDEQRQVMERLGERRPLLNIYRTLVRAPKALSRFIEWGGYILSRRNSLPAREREIVILRVGFLCKSGYEFTQHTQIGLDAGLTADEIARIKAGAGAGWGAADAALIRAADELVGDHFISDATWAALRERFDEKQCMDVVLTAGQYTQVSMLLNSFGVQLEPGKTLDPELRA